MDEDGSKRSSRIKEKEENVLECPVCLQTCQFPVQLPCSHIFCFLCVKGVVTRNKGCALCRQSIPLDYLLKPNLLYEDLIDKNVTFDNGYNWFYEGKDGWWQYDDRTSKELERHHKAGCSTCEVLIAGYVYMIDLNNMVQFRKNDHTKKRRVKRDLISIQGRKGIAGLKLVSENDEGANDRTGADGHETNVASRQKLLPIRQITQPVGNHSCSPPTAHNTPQTITPSESPPSHGPTHCDLSSSLRHLYLTDDQVSPESPQDNPASANFNGNISYNLTIPSMEDIRTSPQQMESNNFVDFFDVEDDALNMSRDGDVL